MNTYLRHILFYFENVIHPAGGSASSEKRKRRLRRADGLHSSPESFNIRGGSKKQDKNRLSPAP